MNAFVLRIGSTGGDRVTEALKDNDLLVGWSAAEGLLDNTLDWLAFREAIHNKYHIGDSSYTGSGRAAGSLWRFIREMNLGDLVVVPAGDSFYVAEVAGLIRHDASRVKDDSAHRRKAKWLNGGKSIPRRYARAALQSRMKVRHTCAHASDLLDEIREVLALAGKGNAPSFHTDLRGRLINQTLEEIRNGRLDSYGFELLLQRVLESMGGTNVRVIPRKYDKGADIIATFSLATSFRFTLAVQAKHFQPSPAVGPEVVDQLVIGMEAEEADLGWVATCGEFSKAAVARKEEVEASKGIRIELVDGEQLAAMIIEGGLRSVSTPRHDGGAAG
jgi:predicted Mrr-cat superfamily restriction endonuclease